MVPEDRPYLANARYHVEVSSRNRQCCWWHDDVWDELTVPEADNNCTMMSHAGQTLPPQC